MVLENQRLEGSLRVILLVCAADAVLSNGPTRSTSAFLSCCWAPVLTGEERHHSNAYARPSVGSCEALRIITYTQSLCPNVYTAGEDESTGE